MLKYEKLPEHMRESMKGYIEEGRPVGEFLTAVLCNQLVDAFALADDTNIARMFDFAQFLYSEAPVNCWRTAKRMKRWMELGGLRGIEEKKRAGIDVPLWRDEDA